MRTLHLDIFGAFHPPAQDAIADGTKTLLLLGPYEPGFWPAFTATPEYNDGKADPLDRWSKRVLAPWAKAQNAQAIFLSDGPPYAPFIGWAQHSGRAWISPIGLLVHDHAGLFISYRAAIALPVRIDPAPTAESPCVGCAQPCRTTCPVNALTGEYDVGGCKSHISTPAGHACMETGCLVRNACPAGQNYGSLPEQSAFHMAAFNPDDPTFDPDPPR